MMLGGTGASPPEPGTVYEIRIAGVVTADVLDALEDVTVVPSLPSTVLSRSIIDQADLLGLLDRLRSLHLDVIEVRRVHRTWTDPAPVADAP